MKLKKVLRVDPDPTSLVSSLGKDQDTDTQGEAASASRGEASAERPCQQRRAFEKGFPAV